MLNLLDLVTNTARAAAGVVDTAAGLVNIVVKPVADVVEAVADGISELRKDDHRPK